MKKCPHGLWDNRTCLGCYPEYAKTIERRALKKALDELSQAFTCFSRNGRWGTCSGCPRTLPNEPYPEFCQFTANADHQLDIDGLTFQWKRARGIAQTTSAQPLVEDHLKLWAHVVAVHANCIPPDVSLKELLDYHHDEHHGPGGIRNHPEESRDADLANIIYVLSEHEDAVDAMPDAALRMHYNLVAETMRKRGLVAEREPTLQRVPMPLSIGVRHEVQQPDGGRVRIDLRGFGGKGLDLSDAEAETFALELMQHAVEARRDAKRLDGIHQRHAKMPIIPDDDPYEGSFRAAADNEGARIAADTSSDE